MTPALVVRIFKILGVPITLPMAGLSRSVNSHKTLLEVKVSGLVTSSAYSPCPPAPTPETNTLRH